MEQVVAVIIATSLVGGAVVTWAAVAFARVFRIDLEVKELQQELLSRDPAWPRDQFTHGIAGVRDDFDSSAGEGSVAKPVRPIW